jgi:hypothetical protein
MSVKRNLANSRHHPLEVSETPEADTNRAVSIAYWALAVLVALCFALVLWFWAVMLWPSHFSTRHDRDARTSAPCYASFVTQAQPPEAAPNCRGN